MDVRRVGGLFLTADMFPPRAADGVNRAPSVSHTPVTTCPVLSGVSHLHTSSGCRKFVTSGSEQIVTSYLSLLELNFSPSAIFKPGRKWSPFRSLNSNGDEGWGWGRGEDHNRLAFGVGAGGFGGAHCWEVIERRANYCRHVYVEYEAGGMTDICVAFFPSKLVFEIGYYVWILFNAGL